ncbi:cysteine desulfurase family protein [candidate division KSB1 bacterium]
MRKFLKILSKIKGKRKRVYLDYAAATPLNPDVLKKMEPYWNKHFGNAGALHQEGADSKRVLNEAREEIARSIASKPEEIIFTASGTEGNSLAVLGFISALRKKLGAEGASIKDSHVITSSAEHPSVLDCFRSFQDEGVSVDFVDFDERGIINPKEVRKLLRKETSLVSISYVNNEIGTAQPIKEIAKEIRAYEKETERDINRKIVFHTDASQAPLYFDCTPEYLGVDLMTIDGQKIYGPKGVGFLYKRNTVTLQPIMKGGNQEHGLRPGTENIPLIVGLKESFVKAVLNRKKETKDIKILQDYFLKLIEKHIPQALLNGDRELRSPNNVNISIPGIDNEYIMIALDEHGIAVATKSACLGYGNGTHSYVIASLYKDKGKDMAKSAIRFSLGRGITKRDIKYVVSVLSDEVKKIDRVVL